MANNYALDNHGAPNAAQAMRRLEYHIVDASTRATVVGPISLMHTAVALCRALDKTRSVNLLCMSECGCLARAIFRTTAGTATRRRHAGWRAVEQCAAHARKKKK